MKISRHFFENGMTVKELKDIINDWPETNPDTGEDCEVWIESGRGSGRSSPVKTVFPLNFRSHSSDILFGET